MIRLLLLAMALLLNGRPAVAGLSRSELADVSVELPAGAHLDLDVTAHDSTGRSLTMRQIFAGRPALVTFADFTCTSLCSADLRLLSAALEGAGLSPGEYRLAIIGIDPKDPPGSAETMAAGELAANVRASTTLLLPDAPTVHRLAGALGFRYVYDPAIDQFAHPAAVYVVGADGAVRTVLSPFALDTAALKGALFAPDTEAGPSLFESIRILCYALDPATGVYTLRIMTLLKIGGALTAVLIAGGVILLARRRRS